MGVRFICPLYDKTFEENLFDIDMIKTVKPDNTQQVAISAFQDWGKTASRNSASAPVLGDGIFSQDASAWKHTREPIISIVSR